ncbi:LacI family DNA-binding transcriptional regulator [Pseudarthrobacter sp. NPDC092184]|uniref:LacI family DNA-binding transcriptional regulator n=1 Tax=unclassified Pseudarthrobacter TaxID=2647000 RepID=UPI00382D71E0
MVKRKATALDVARRAGVSRSAVSLVLNGRATGNVTAERQERVLRAAAELDYTPNSVAVSLRNQQTSTIGIITDDIVTSPFAGRLISGASRTALARGYMVLVVDTEHDKSRESAAAQQLVHRQVDGIMYAAGSLREITAPPAMLTLPAILANCTDADSGLQSVIPAEVEGGRAAAQLLIDLGHRRITLLTGTLSSPAAPQRELGYREAMEAAGLGRDQQHVHATGWDIDEGYRAASSVLGGSNPPTAIVCSNDRVATGVLLYAAAAGLRVPTDLSVVGYDDQQNLAANLVPALTTVALPHAEIGAAAMSMLLDAVEGKTAATEDKEEGTLHVPCRVIPRASTAAVPAG